MLLTTLQETRNATTSSAAVTGSRGCIVQPEASCPAWTSIVGTGGTNSCDGPELRFTIVNRVVWLYVDDHRIIGGQGRNANQMESGEDPSRQRPWLRSEAGSLVRLVNSHLLRNADSWDALKSPCR